MKDTRDGFLTSDQEEVTDELIPLTGIYEKLDGPAIKIADNRGLQALKGKLIEKYGEGVLQDIYEVIDLIYMPLTELVKARKKG